jgi:tRNA A58 N-methylase Trm61
MSSDNKYCEDKADPQMNVSDLDEVFNIDNSVINKQVQEVTDMRKEIQELEDSLPDVDSIILDNITRANNLLDKIEDSLGRGDVSARLLEVAGQLINAVTSAAVSITGMGHNQQQIDVKNRALDIKEKENTIKDALKGAKEVNITNNNLTMSRESILDMIKEDE